MARKNKKRKANIKSKMLNLQIKAREVQDIQQYRDLKIYKTLKTNKNQKLIKNKIIQ